MRTGVRAAALVGNCCAVVLAFKPCEHERRAAGREPNSRLRTEGALVARAVVTTRTAQQPPRTGPGSSGGGQVEIRGESAVVEQVGVGVVVLVDKLARGAGEAGERGRY